MPRLTDAQYGEMRRLLNAGQSHEKVNKQVPRLAPGAIARPPERAEDEDND